MKDLLKKFIFVFIALLTLGLFSCSDSEGINDNQDDSSTVVGKYGKLSVSGSSIIDKNGGEITLRGMSLFWSQWGADYYNKETIKWLRDDWKCTVIRAAMGVESGGYLENPQWEYHKIKTVLDACIEFGIYVIIDWHDHHGENHLEEAKKFFDDISIEYGAYPNIIYEIYNEPLDVSWKNVLHPHSQSIINVIRKNDPDNLIIVGTPNWSQDVDHIIGSKIDDPNVAYSLHFYTGTHRKWLRDKAINALNAKIPIFVSEWGVSEANGNGEIDIAETNHWKDFLEENTLSWCNWSVINKDETSAILVPSNTKLSGWNEEELSDAGNMIRNYLIRMNSNLFE